MNPITKEIGKEIMREVALESLKENYDKYDCEFLTYRNVSYHLFQQMPLTNQFM